MKPKRIFKIKFPNLKDPKLAEFVGILLGDGSLGIYECKSNGKIKLQYRVKVTLNSIDDKEYVQYVERLIFQLFGLMPIKKFKKNEKVCELLIFRKDILSFLIQKVGLRLAPKWKRAIIPSRYLGSRLELNVLRGYFDTDGSVVITKNNGILYPRLEMKVSPSPMQKQIIKILERRKFRFGVYSIGKGKVRIQLNGISQLRKWIKEIGFKNPKHLKKIAGWGIEPQ